MFTKHLLVFILSLLLLSCNNPNNKSLLKDNDSVKIIAKANDSSTKSGKDKSVIKAKIFHFDLIKVDTVFGNFHISYKVQDDDQVITTYPITDGKGQDTAYYANSEVVVSVSKAGKSILSERKIKRSDFKSYIPQKEISKYCITYFKVKSASSNGIIFSISLCIPDTDVCYWFELHIGISGQIKINEVVEKESEM